MKNLIFKSFKTSMFLLLMAYIVAGQSSTGVIKGSVSDQNGAVIAGAKVSLIRHGNSEAIRQTSTNYEGEFIFFDVIRGEYEIEVKVTGINKNFRRQVTLTSPASAENKIVISLEPCSDENETGIQDKLTDIDRAEIVRELINLKFPNLSDSVKDNMQKIIFSDDNIKAEWLNTEQKQRIKIITRREIQDLTERTGQLTYFSITKMIKKGGCVSVSLNQNLTVQGQLEDANMAGSKTAYEVRKVNGRWTAHAVMSLIS